MISLIVGGKQWGKSNGICVMESRKYFANPTDNKKTGTTYRASLLATTEKTQFLAQIDVSYSTTETGFLKPLFSVESSVIF
jgi:hypothetical protein